MTHLRLYVIAFMLAFLCFACSSQQNAGGGIETTNGGIVAGRVFRADGTPASHARILARLIATPQDSILAFSDSAGNYQVKKLGKGMVSLSVLDTGAQGAVFHVACNGDTSLQVADAHLAPLKILRGTLFCNGSPCAGTVTIPELGLSTSALADGSFSLSQVNPGVFIVHAVASGDSSLATSVVVHADSILTLNLSTTKQVLFEDFETNHSGNAVDLDMTEGFWYFASDTSFASGSSVVTPSCAVNFSNETCYDTLSAYQGHSEQINVSFGGSMPVHFAMLGVNIWAGKASADTSRRWFNLQAMDSLSFYAKGNCSAAFQFITERRVLLGEENHYQTFFTVTSDWNRYVIHTSDIQIAIAGEPAWSEVSKRTAGFSILLQSDCDLDLDNIVVYGLWPEDMQ